MNDAGHPTASRHAPSAPAGNPAGAAVCTACALLCDDVRHAAGGALEGACDRGREASAALRLAAASGIPAASIDGRPAASADAVREAARRLRAARRVLVCGLAAVSVEAASVACDLAEALGAGVAGASDEEAGPGGAAIARHGEITAAWEELRDRADVVAVWFHDPSPGLPRFAERFLLPPTADGRDRTVTWVGRRPSHPLAAGHRHLALPPDVAVDLARSITAATAGLPAGAVPPAVERAAADLTGLFTRASCVGIVTGAGDGGGLGRAAVVGMVRALSARVGCFEIPLATCEAGPNAAGAAAVLSWRYGTAADLARATPPSLPVAGSAATLPFDAAKALGDGGFDHVLALSALTPRLAAAVASLRDGIPVVNVGGDAAPRRGIHLATAATGDDGDILVRADGTTIPLPAATIAGAPPSARRVLADLLAAVVGEAPA